MVLKQGAMTLEESTLEHVRSAVIRLGDAAPQAREERGVVRLETPSGHHQRGPAKCAERQAFTDAHGRKTG